MITIKTHARIAIFCALALLLASGASAQGRFLVSFPPTIRSQPATGRLILLLSRTGSPEPRLTMSQNGPPIFGTDVTGLKPSEDAIVDETALGSPIRMADLPAGEYFAQAVLNVYTECRRSDGHTVRVYMGESLGTNLLNTAPGNLYSDVVKVQWDPKARPVTRLELTRVMPAQPDPPDTPWLKHVRIQSKLLSAFWGHPVYIGATVLLPKGYDDHPSSRYPAVYVHEHGIPFSFSTVAGNQERERASARSANLQTGYEFYQSWVSDGFPRFIAITLHQPTPFFPSSYSVNSANVGPYGDALLQEVIPYLERQFRIIAEPYARLVEGASTGGWEALSLQLHYPDVFGGAWVFNPDPIDFTRWQLVNIYEDENAFVVPGSPEWRSIERPFRRTPEGQVVDTQRSMSLFEAVLGSHGRSGNQINGWEAVYGPVGADGYPVPLWDPLTGKIDRQVATYMRDNGYDLRYYAEKNWATLGPKLIGKLNFFSGEMDNFYLNLAVYRFQQFLANTSSPHYDGRFEFGRPMKGHNWHLTDWAGLLREMAEHVKKNAPAGADLRGWNY